MTCEYHDGMVMIDYVTNTDILVRLEYAMLCYAMK